MKGWRECPCSDIAFSKNSPSRLYLVNSKKNKLYIEKLLGTHGGLLFGQSLRNPASLNLARTGLSLLHGIMDQPNRWYRSRKVAGDLGNQAEHETKQETDAFKVRMVPVPSQRFHSQRSRHSAIVGEAHPNLMKTRGRCLRAP